MLGTYHEGDNIIFDESVDNVRVKLDTLGVGGVITAT